MQHDGLAQSIKAGELVGRLPKSFSQDNHYRSSFYTSMECLYNQVLHDKPVAVFSSIEERHGIVLAANL